MLRALLFGVAIASGGVAAWLVTSAQSPAISPAIGAASVADSALAQMVEVLVAARDVDQGVQLHPEDMRWQEWPEIALAKSSITRANRPTAIEDLTGSVVRGSLVTGELVVDEKLAPTRSSFLSAVLKPGMRAVAIRSSAETTAGGFILPNDRVDVLLAVPCRSDEVCSNAMSVRTILRNARVLAIDQSGNESGMESTLVGKTVTLELDPEQVETLIGAEAMGTLALVLRSAADHQESQEIARDTGRTVRIRRPGVADEYVKVR